MPAVTVDDVLVLPRLPRLDAEATTFRAVRRLVTAPSGFEGEGFPVRRAFAGVPMSELDPFIHLDQMGEVDYAPGEPKGTPWHPHRGFETVTYMIDGIFDHQDSNGGGGTITNGDTQWMTAGSGLLHIEAPPEHLVMSGGLFHGLQLWVNLPRVKKMSPPRYQDIRGKESALLTTLDGGALIPGHRGRGRRTPRPRLDPHPDHHCPCDRSARRSGRPAMAARLQRPRLRPERRRDGGR
jgi:redox-sensitive bicupin YhaK (pirin superfamily)